MCACVRCSTKFNNRWFFSFLLASSSSMSVRTCPSNPLLLLPIFSIATKPNVQWSLSVPWRGLPASTYCLYRIVKSCSQPCCRCVNLLLCCPSIVISRCSTFHFICRTDTVSCNSNCPHSLFTQIWMSICWSGCDPPYDISIPFLPIRILVSRVVFLGQSSICFNPLSTLLVLRLWCYLPHLVSTALLVRYVSDAFSLRSFV